MDVDMDLDVTAAPTIQQQLSPPASQRTTPPQGAPARDSFRDISVKVHMRRSGKDSWAYLGRGIVSHEASLSGNTIMVRSAAEGKDAKPWVCFNESTDLQAEKRGNFVVIGAVDFKRNNNSVCSWSLNALNNSETLRLLATIELTCYKAKQAVADPGKHAKLRKKVEKLIKDDRRKRHRRRKDQEVLIDLFAKSNINEHLAPETGPIPNPNLPPPQSHQTPLE